MKLKDGFITRKIMDDTVLMNLADAAQLVRLNETAAEILAFLTEGCTEEEIAEKLATMYDVEKEQAFSDVQNTVATFRSLGALED